MSFTQPVMETYVPLFLVSNTRANFKHARVACIDFSGSSIPRLPLGAQAATFGSCQGSASRLPFHLRVLRNPLLARFVQRPTAVVCLDSGQLVSLVSRDRQGLKGRSPVMLVLSRKVGQRVVVPDCDVAISVLKVRGDRVCLGIFAPAELPVHREEVYERLKKSTFQGAANPDEEAAP
jgi:carbon storage regulator